ncbi:MAG: glucosamine-6-phosphate deaminase [Agriterribacter sp.]
MNIIISEDYAAMSRRVANDVNKVVQEKPGCLVCIPSGDTPTGMYNNLAEDYKEGKLNIEQTYFVGLDEWGGLNKEDNGSCGYYLHKYFLDPLHVKQERYFLFDGKADDLRNECLQAEAFIDDKGGIELAILGLGMNGHLGINEPGVSPELRTHVIRLDELTKKVGQKYFDKATSLSTGITIGLQLLLEAKIIFLLVSGKHKADILYHVVNGEISNKVPASLLRNHGNCFVYVDKAAGEKI